MDDKVNILAVDDSPDKLLALCVLLGELHQNVVKASSGREALRALLKDEFAVVLLDVNMPGMDGFETAALIRERRATEHTPIIFITSYPDETHASRGYSLGAVDYILAPVDPEVLRTKVMVFVELFRKTAQIRNQARTLEQKAEQLERLTEASFAINSALSPAEMLQAVAVSARDILGAHQAVAVAAADQKWSRPASAVALSPAYEREGERRVFVDREALLAFLASAPRCVRGARGSVDAALAPVAHDEAATREGWIAAPLASRDGRRIGLIHLLDKRDGDFTVEDETVLMQLASMTSIAIENLLNAEAREANRIKDEFLTTLSHELRTPLSAILGWTRTLRGGGTADPAKVEHGLEVIERNVRAQTTLIADLLDVSRIITGKLRLTVRPVPLTPIMDAAIDTMRPAAEAKEIEISVERLLAQDGEDIVVGDPDRLQQVVWNLVSNAIKFTPSGGRVTVSLVRTDTQFEIRVTDTGRGISPDFLPRIFERFRQADSTPTRTHGGLGIGLAIARHLVELHGGTITAESAGDNAGATLTVSLPRVALGMWTLDTVEREEVAAAPAVGSAAVDLGGLRVLLVEDEPDGRELMSEVLSAAGARVLAAGDAQEAMSLFESERPDVLVSDIGMPREDGYSLLRRIRSQPAEGGGMVPAVAVTAYAREEDRLRALAEGFQAHAPKPIDPADLVRTVARVAGILAAPADSERREEVPVVSVAAGAPGTAVEGNGRPSRVLVVEDDVDSREGLRHLLEIWGHDVDVADTASSGVEKAIAGRPDVVLIDIGLGHEDGYSVARRIREALGSNGTYLVAITGYAAPEDRRRALESGFDAHVGKPIDFEQLSSLLASRIPQPESARAAASGTAS